MYQNMSNLVHLGEPQNHYLCLYLDTYEIISNYNTNYWNDRNIQFKFIKPILKKYDFVV